MKSSWLIWLLTTTVSVAGISYLAYFDYKRRSDPAFRRRIKTEKRKAARKKLKEEQKKKDLMESWMRRAMDVVASDAAPQELAEREAYVVKRLENGESLLKRLIAAGSDADPDLLINAAAEFYKVLKIFPNPTQLLEVLQQQAPESLMTLMFAMIGAEASLEQERYFQSLSNKHPNVIVKFMKSESSDDENFEVKTKPKTHVVSTRVFAQGELILSDDPVVSCAYSSLSSSDFLPCQYCLKPLSDIESQDPDALFTCQQCCDTMFEKSIYCSSNCRAHAAKQFHNVLCPGNPANTAAKDLHMYCTENGLLYPMLIARFIAKMIWKQSLQTMQRMSNTDPSSAASLPAQQPQIQEEWMHLEYLGYTPVPITDELVKECEILRKALGYASPGATEFLTVERYAAIKGSFMQNTYGHALPSGGIDYSAVLMDKGESGMKPRSHVESERIYGASLHFCIAHVRKAENENDANVRVEFEYAEKTGFTPKAQLIAIKDIAEGEELKAAYSAFAQVSDLVGK